jgi:hypothetical protein
MIAFGCGHKQTCATCSRTLLTSSDPSCPICRKPIELCIQVFD